MYRFLIIILHTILPIIANAQSIKKSIATKKKNFIYQLANNTTTAPQQTLGIIAKANSDGWAAGFCYNKKINEFTHKYYCIELSERKHAKEEKIKTSLPIYQDFGKQISFVYGKINSLYTLNFQYGKTRILLPTFILPSISISWQYYGGLGISMLKPYSLQIKTIDHNQLAIAQDISYPSNNIDTFLNKNIIYSRSHFDTYWQQSKWLSNINIGTGLLAVIANGKAFTTSINAGICSNIYYKNIRLMANENGKWGFVNGYVGMVVCKKW